MKNPLFNLMAMVLTCCILGGCILIANPSNPSASICESEVGCLEGSAEDSFETLSDNCFVLRDFELYKPVSRDLYGPLKPLTDLRAFSAYYYAFGWMLPLRV